MTIQEQIKMVKGWTPKETRVSSGLSKGVFKSYQVVTEYDACNSPAVNSCVEQEGVCVAVSFGCYLVPADTLQVIDKKPQMPEGFVPFKINSVNVREHLSDLRFFSKMRNEWRKKTDPYTWEHSKYCVRADSPLAKQYNLGNWDKTDIPEPPGGWNKYEDLGIGGYTECDGEGVLYLGTATREWTRSFKPTPHCYYVRKKQTFADEFKEWGNICCADVELSKQDLAILLIALGCTTGTGGQDLYNRLQDNWNSLEPEWDVDLLREKLVTSSVGKCVNIDLPK